MHKRFTPRTIGIFTLACVLVAFRLLAVDALRTSAASIVVDTTAGDLVDSDGFCSLQEAMWNAFGDDQSFVDCAPGSGPDVISFSVTGVITLSSTLPNVEGDLTVSGPGPDAAALTISGGDAIRPFTVASTGRLTLNLLTLSNGSAPSHGGCLYSEGQLVVNSSVINTCQTPAGYNGGAIMNLNGILSLTNSIVENSQADFAGGIDSFGTLVMDNSIVRYNRTRLDGGGGIGASTWLTISNSLIYSNSAQMDGGGLYVQAGTQTSIRDSRIEANRPGAGSYGGGLFNVGMTGLTNVTLAGNQSSARGGGIYNSGVLTLTGSTLTGNTASDGGGLYNQASALVSNTLFDHNQVGSSYGGGIYNTGALTLTDSMLDSNRGGFAGGIGNTGVMSLTNVTLSRNVTTQYNGAGIYNSGPANLLNVTLSGNRSNFDGGAIYNTGPLNLNNVTLYDNAANRFGGGMMQAGNTATLKNSIVANSPSGGNCYYSSGTLTSNNSNLSSDDSCTLYFNKGKDQNNQPAQLGPLANNGGATLTHLPLPPIVLGFGPIDNGSCPVGADQRGVARPQGNACDIGAVEYRTGETTPWLYLPLILR